MFKLLDNLCDVLSELTPITIFDDDGPPCGIKRTKNFEQHA